MALTPEIARQIEQEITQIKKNDIQLTVSNKSLNSLIYDFGSTLAQAEIDLSDLVNVGFDATTMQRNYALLELMSLTYGTYSVLTPESVEQRVHFDQQLALARLDKKRLIVICDQIFQDCNNDSLRQKYSTLDNGTGIIVTLKNILTMVNIIYEYSEKFSQIKPNRIEIDIQYCEKAKSRALELLMFKGVIVNCRDASNDTVDRQNKLLTLCMNIQNEIKKFAFIAFSHDIEYYECHYSSNHNYRLVEEDTDSLEAQSTTMR